MPVSLVMRSSGCLKDKKSILTESAMSFPHCIFFDVKTNNFSVGTNDFDDHSRQICTE